MKVSIDDLKGLPQNRLLVAYREELTGISAIKPVIGELTVLWSSSSVKVSGQVKTLLKLQCDRCLGPYFQSLSVDIEERFVPEYLLSLNEKEHQREQRELLRDDFVEPLPDNGLLDISDIVYQAVTLSTPTYSLCGPECPGPPKAEKAGTAGNVADSGGNSREAKRAGSEERPIDPRWKNLKTLFPNEDSEQNS